MSSKLLLIICCLVATDNISAGGQYKIPIRFGNVTLIDRSDGNKDVIVHQGINIGGFGGIAGLTFFDRNGSFETSNAGALLLNGKLYGNNETITFSKQGIDVQTKYYFGNKTFHGGLGKEGQAVGQFLNHVSDTLLAGLQFANKQVSKPNRRRRRFTPHF
ncbi:unnamed protein product [Thelazia callipaeda]|uniref:Dirigent protein n=1 Tax=Thelazia callipaeda TaxID=103827 RepID=A0A0N5CU26_THECL|nr:unnamed protein product [Thelazia callipaeda]